MKKKDLIDLENFFYEYADGFISNDIIHNRPFLMKKEHTRRVCLEIARLSEQLSLSREEKLFAKAAGLLHDIGRFRQYKEHGTFLDAKSVNHAALGCEVIKQEHILDFCTEKEQQLLLNLVFFHNVFALPKDLDKHNIFLLKLLRDADKLDIWEVVTDHYLSYDFKNDKFISLGLKNDDKFSSKVLESIFKGHVVENKFVKRLNDLKLLQISWVFDLNFTQSIKRIQEKGCLEKIFSTFPETEEIEKVVKYVRDYIKKSIY